MEDNEAFLNHIKDVVIRDGVLVFLQHKEAFILHTDSSDFAVRVEVELSQMQNRVERVIIYYIKYSLTPAQRKYCTTRKEFSLWLDFLNNTSVIRLVAISVSELTTIVLYGLCGSRILKLRVQDGLEVLL